MWPTPASYLCLNCFYPSVINQSGWLQQFWPIPAGREYCIVQPNDLSHPEFLGTDRWLCSPLIVVKMSCIQKLPKPYHKPGRLLARLLLIPGIGDHPGKALARIFPVSDCRLLCPGGRLPQGKNRLPAYLLLLRLLDPLYHHSLRLWEQFGRWLHFLEY